MNRCQTTLSRIINSTFSGGNQNDFVEKWCILKTENSLEKKKPFSLISNSTVSTINQNGTLHQLLPSNPPPAPGSFSHCCSDFFLHSLSARPDKAKGRNRERLREGPACRTESETERRTGSPLVTISPSRRQCVRVRHGAVDVVDVVAVGFADSATPEVEIIEVSGRKCDDLGRFGLGGGLVVVYLRVA
ncbi:hypothetical protein GWI33_017390 [Rhynchophorus ferrugineus]|uniref:Uncharacterized protein n=1 Tax=Rhynchophorus ferrugineus TaxID=354439 RepID=A0A834MN00_RHYFE|nr:hypothetical protein GWI33_017390 [Rhynchophorus ferrugineus]